MQTTIPLYQTDLVILRSNGDFLKFKNGEIVIYNDIKEANDDSKHFPQSKVSNCLKLSRRNRKVLRKNIKEFGLPF